MKKFFLISLCIFICGCSLKPKHQKTLIGAAAGGVIGAASVNSGDNESVALSGGAAAGALLTWGIYTYLYDQNSEELLAENNKLQQQIDLIDKIEKKDSSIKRTPVEKWVPVSESNQKKKLKFIQQEHEESRP